MNLDHLKRPVLFAGLIVVIGVASAASPHFVKGPTAVLDNGNAVVSWKEAGLGSNVLIEYDASAHADVLYQCVTNSNHCPAATNKQKLDANVHAFGAFSSGKNGAITASLTISPPDSTLSCPPGQRRELVSVSYTGIRLDDLTTPVGAPATPSSLSQSGFECP
jgi:hypothetical protein